eukprot:1178740-Prorocentrum_minimum.AAC.3
MPAYEPGGARAVCSVQTALANNRALHLGNNSFFFCAAADTPGVNGRSEQIASFEQIALASDQSTMYIVLIPRLMAEAASVTIPETFQPRSGVKRQYAGDTVTDTG